MKWVLILCLTPPALADDRPWGDAPVEGRISYMEEPSFGLFYIGEVIGNKMHSSNIMVRVTTWTRFCDGSKVQATDTSRRHWLHKGDEAVYGDLKVGQVVHVDFYGYPRADRVVIISREIDDDDLVRTVERWVAELPEIRSVYDGLDRSTGAILKNLGSRSGAVRERASRELWELDRTRILVVAEWGRVLLKHDPEVQQRIDAILFRLHKRDVR